MPYRNRSFQAPVKRDKHEVTWTNLAQDASTKQSIVISVGVDVGDKNTSTECAIGSHVRSIYFEFHFSAQVVTNPKVIHWNLIFQKAGETVASPASYYQVNRAIIFKRGMEMLPPDTSTVFKRVFVVRVPKHFQRVRDGAAIIFEYISSSSETINTCGFAIYKEIY